MAVFTEIASLPILLPNVLIHEFTIYHHDYFPICNIWNGEPVIFDFYGPGSIYCLQINMWNNDAEETNICRYFNNEKIWLPIKPPDVANVFKSDVVIERGKSKTFNRFSLTPTITGLSISLRKIDPSIIESNFIRPKPA